MKMPTAEQALTLVAEALNLAPRPPATAAGGQYVGSYSSREARYEETARAYQGNEIVYAAIELLATSAAEPPIVGKRWRRGQPNLREALRNAGLENASVRKALGTGVEARERAVIQNVIHNTRVQLKARGIPQRYHDAMLVRNGFIEEIVDHPLVKLLNHPNPFMSRFQFYATLIMDRYIAGNAYFLRVRGALGTTQELWRLRPDRVRVVADERGQVVGYTYTVGRDVVTYPAEDVIHWKTRNPWDEHYGQPPLLAFMDRITIDNFMRRFLGTFYRSGGTGPGAILTVKGELDSSMRAELAAHLKRAYGQPDAIAETIILDNTESSYERLGLDRGLTDALPKDVNAVNESRLAMAFGIPGSVLGLLIGYESSSYANKRQDWQVLWDVTLAPLFSDLDDVLNLRLTPDFSGIDEVYFDLSQIRALQEDEDALHKRARDNYDSGLWSQQESRMVTGVEPEAANDELFILRSGASVVKYGDLGAAPEPATPIPPPAPVQQLSAGRPRIEQDAAARAIHDRAIALKSQYPAMTWEQVAARVSVSDRTLREYRIRFAAQVIEA